MTKTRRSRELLQTNPATDAELFARVATGELAALGDLYDRHAEDVRDFVARAVGRGGDVDDLVQEVFLTAARAAGRFDGRESARPFLIGVATQLVRRRRRSLARLTRALVAFGTVFSRAPLTPEHEASAAEDHACFEDALTKLTEEKRLVFLLHTREGLRGDEIAKALDIPVNTVWTRLYHARRELLAALARGAP